MADKPTNVLQIVDGNRYEVNDHGRKRKAGEGYKVGPLIYVRSKVNGHTWGAGWRALLEVAGKSQAASAFGVFHKLLELAADQKAEWRWVIRDHRGTPVTSRELPAMTGFSRRTIERALEVLTDTRVAWLEWVECGEKRGNAGECGGLPTIDVDVDVELEKELELEKESDKDLRSSTSGDQKFSSKGRASGTDAEFWTRVSDRVTRSLGKLTPPKAAPLQPKTPLDWSLIYKACAIVERDLLPEGWLTSSINAVRDSKAKQKNPWAYFQTCLVNQANERGKMLKPMLGLHVPAELLKPPDGKNSPGPTGD